MIPLVNNVPFIPNLADWDKPRLTYRFATSIAGGLNGSEDRATAGQIGKYRAVDYKLTARSTEERAVLAERLKAALLSRSAAVPIFMRQQNHEAWVASQVGGGAVITSPVVAGSWPWTVGDKAYIALAEHDGLNRDVLINCGGSEVVTETGQVWQADCLYTSGTPYSVADSTVIDITKEPYLVCPPQPVLRTCRARVVGQMTRYTVTGLKPGVMCIVRLWFATIETGQTGQISIAVTGMDSEVTRFWSPYEEAGSVYNKVVCKQYYLCPDLSGTMDILIGHELGSTTQFISAVEIRQAVWDVFEIGTITQNGTRRNLTPTKKLNIIAGEQLFVVCPILFGEPSIGDWDYETPEFASVKLTVKEPLGSIVAKREAECSDEICGLPAIPPVPPGPSPEKVGDFASMFVVITDGTDPGEYFEDPTTMNAYAIALAQAEWAAWDERSATDPDANGTYAIQNGAWVGTPEGGGGWTSSLGAVPLMNKYLGMGSIDNYTVGVETVQASREEEDGQFTAAYHVRAVGGGGTWWFYTFEIWFTPTA